MSINDKNQFIEIIIILGIIVFLCVLYILRLNNTEFKSMVDNKEFDDIFLSFLLYLTFLLCAASIIRSLLFILRFTIFKFRAERFVGKVASIGVVRSMWPPEGWVMIGRRLQPTAGIEFVDEAENLIAFKEIADHRLRVGQSVIVLYDKKSGFKSLDDYLLVSIHLWSLACAGFLFWLIVSTDVLW